MFLGEPVSILSFWRGGLGVLMLVALFCPGLSRAEPPPRTPLDALWNEHMLTGTSTTVYVDDAGQRTLSIPRSPFDDRSGMVSGIVSFPESAAATTRGIVVARLDERFLIWRNGGWFLQG